MIHSDYVKNTTNGWNKVCYIISRQSSIMRMNSKNYSIPLNDKMREDLKNLILDYINAKNKGQDKEAERLLEEINILRMEQKT